MQSAVNPQIYLVGGAVRDRLLGLEVVDRDFVVVGTTPQVMLAQGFLQVGNQFPVFLHPQTHEEYALARIERKSGHGYQGFNVDFPPSVTLEQDLKRRDLTINAIAENEHGEIIDPYGGQHDLANRTLRHISDAFKEDPLRVLRVARFYARFAHLGFTIAPETLALMRDMAKSGELAFLTPERVWLECEKALLSQNPEHFFSALHECGALAILFPEIDALFGVPNPAKHHPEIDSGIHTLMVLHQSALLTANESSERKIKVRFAALTHDLGKALTPKDILPHHYGHEERGVQPTQQLCQRLKVPSAVAHFAILSCRYHSHIHRITEMKASTIIRFFDRIDVWRKPDNLTDLTLVCTADSRGRTGFENAVYPQAALALQLYRAACQTNVQDIITSGFHGAQIREQLTKTRIALVQHAKAQLILAENP
ncbi:multifunctional CCA addition/repair protein [Spirabiliibacterium falconis]|uniref:multifunctional CCA addition/repair protein n=1 Tax=Spirabiliibacterium falconis TaxID=572023 RepID=UPI001AAD2465|nr:multifunctional CCA addition/repair protein [Spirabiliibacterium falconis]MBE2894007.1 multifunctional CCA addition/repair protein [Spirabiliibacterium falconis]